MLFALGFLLGFVPMLVLVLWVNHTSGKDITAANNDAVENARLYHSHILVDEQKGDIPTEPGPKSTRRGLGSLIPKG